MKRIMLLIVILLPGFLLITGTRRVSRNDRLEQAPMAPRPEAESRHDAHLRFAWQDSDLLEPPIQTAALVQIKDARPDDDTSVCEIDGDPQGPTRLSTGTHTRLASDWMSSEERARDDLREKLLRQLNLWLVDEGVDPTWEPPAVLADRVLPAEFEVVEQDRDYLRMYRASTAFSVTSENRQRLVREYDRQIAEKRLGLMGGVLVFVLACLGVSTVYVRADEATRGYYTNRLRLVAAVSVGAAGILLYDWLKRGG